MADLYNYITETGVITPDITQIQAGVEAEYKAAFGQDLIITPDTPQGALITAEVLARKAVADNNVLLAAQFNPNLAGGIFLDALGALTGAVRVAQTPTLVGNVSLAGVPGTIIPAGSQVQTQSGNVFSLITAVTLGTAGQGLGNFAAVDNPLLPQITPPAPGTLTQIVTPVPGWETVNNTGTTITGVTLTGTPGTIIPAGQKAQVVGGQTFVTTQQITLPASVTVPPSTTTTTSVNMIAENYGAFAILPNTLTQLIAPPAGLTGITNDTNAAVTLGVSTISPNLPQQTDASFRDFRRQTIAIQGGNQAASVLGAIASVQGVSDVLMRENPTGKPDANGLDAHTIYLCVDGGLDADVAAAINAKKGGGCGYNHLTGGIPIDVPVTNAYSGQVITVAFDRPAYVLLYVDVTVKANLAVGDPITSVTTALTNLKLPIGQDVGILALAGAIATAVPGLIVISLTVSTGGAFTTNDVAIAIYQRARIASVQVTIV